VRQESPIQGHNNVCSRKSGIVRKDGSFLGSHIFFSQEENLNLGNWEETALFIVTLDGKWEVRNVFALFVRTGV
jgi:hypothetical protein